MDEYRLTTSLVWSQLPPSITRYSRLAYRCCPTDSIVPAMNDPWFSDGVTSVMRGSVWTNDSEVPTNSGVSSWPPDGIRPLGGTVTRQPISVVYFRLESERLRKRPFPLHDAGQDCGTARQATCQHRSRYLTFLKLADLGREPEVPDARWTGVIDFRPRALIL